jgi:hypothetical protein
MLRAIRELSASPIAAVTERQTSAPTAPEQAPKETAERRQVTVMFSDGRFDSTLCPHGPGGPTRGDLRLPEVCRRDSKAL